MNVCRQVLEAIWEEKPYGYMDQFKKELKARKGQRQFRVETSVYQAVKKDSVASVVWAKDYIAAQGKVHDQHVEQLRRTHRLNQWDGTVSYRSVAQKVES